MVEIPDRWIMRRLQHTIQSVRQGIESFRFNDATRAIHSFVWGEYCDWYLELIKPRLYGENEEAAHRARSVALAVLDAILRMLHPFMPFITEEIWQALPLKEIENGSVSIMQQAYPELNRNRIEEQAEREMDLIQGVIGAVRNIRGEMNVPQDKKARAVIRGPAGKLDMINRYPIILEKLAGVSELETGETASKPAECATGLFEDLEIWVPLEGLIDLAAERDRIDKEIARLEQLAKNINLKLTNHAFVQKAPPAVVDKEKQKQTDVREKLKKLKESRKTLG
jgi:valyl-tRNA synthetase